MTKAKNLHEALERRRKILLRQLAECRDNEPKAVRIAKELKRISSYGQEEE